MAGLEAGELLRWTTVIAGSPLFGRFLDHWITRQEERRLRTRLLIWRGKLDRVRLDFLARFEAAAAVRWIDKFFGAHLFSVKRLAAILLIYLLVLQLAIMALDPPASELSYLMLGIQAKCWVVLSITSLALAISATRKISTVIARRCGKGLARNIAALVVMLYLQTWCIYFESLAHSLHELLTLIAFQATDFDNPNYWAQFHRMWVTVLKGFWEGRQAANEAAGAAPTPSFWMMGWVSWLLSPLNYRGAVFIQYEILPTASIWSIALVSVSRMAFTAAFIGAYFLRALPLLLVDIFKRLAEEGKKPFTMIGIAVSVVALLIKALIGWG